MFWKKKKTDRKIEERREAKSKIASLMRALQTKEPKGVYKQFTECLRNFFGRFLNLNYKFTYEELKNEINKRKDLSEELKEKSHEMLDAMIVKEYAGGRITSAGLKSQIKELMWIVEEAFSKKEENEEKK